jgi:AAA+ ATPase superfamily predicted ATPase
MRLIAMENPFNYSGIVTDEAFCNRETELKELIKYVRDSQNVLLYSHRRFGKTSLIFKVFERLQKQKPKIDALYVDLFGTLSERDFVAELLASLGQIEGRIEKLVTMVRNTIRNVKFGFGVDPLSGKPDVSISFEAGYVESYLNNVMEFLEKLSRKRRLVLVFDEFQEIAFYGIVGFEKRLRKHIQRHAKISYIFCGSRCHIMSEMFNDQNRALYKQALDYPLGKIATKDYLSWAEALFLNKNMKIELNLIEEVVSRCDNHPIYVQQFLYHLWDAAEPAFDDLDEVEATILRKNNNQYLTLWESLTLNQKKTLKLVIATGGKKIFHAAAIHAADLQSSAQVIRALESLIAKDIVTKNGEYRIQDAMIKKWIQALL